MYKKTLDHLGNEYKSETEMCKHYGINRGTYLNRIRIGWSKEDALTKDKRDINHNPVCVDHLGNEFKNQQAMCDHYGIDPSNFFKRILRGWTLEDSLTKPIKKYNVDPNSVDHLGNEYKTETEMCKHYDICLSTYHHRIQAGWSKEDALTKDAREINHNPIVVDHLGNTFQTQKAMCDHHGISSALFIKRIEKGWTLEDALTKPVKKNSRKPIFVDHNGKAFPSQSVMCRYYEIDISLFRHRILNGMSLESALTKPINHKNNK